MLFTTVTWENPDPDEWINLTVDYGQTVMGKSTYAWCTDKSCDMHAAVDVVEKVSDWTGASDCPHA